MKTLCFFFILLSLWMQQGALAVTEFIVPPIGGTEDDYTQDQVYLLGTRFSVQWTTDLTNYSVYLWQQVLPGGAASEAASPVYSKGESQPEEGGFLWEVATADLTLGSSPVFFFALGTSPSLADCITCHYFNITADAASIPSSTSPTSSIAAATSTTSQTSSTVSSTETVTSPSNVSTNTPSPSSTSTSGVTNSNSASLKIALGVGLGVGIPIIMLLAGLLYFKIRNHQAQTRNIVPPYEQTPAKHSSYITQNPYLGNQHDNSHLRASDGYQRYELPVNTPPPQPPIKPR